jgi:hypothetical protein
MNKSFNTFLLLSLVLVLPGCAGGLVKDVYKYSDSPNGQDSVTSVVILSNLPLSDAEIESIRRDFLSEDERFRKYLLAYLLAKRTQENEYVEYFIKESSQHLEFLKDNRTGWVSIKNPVYELLSIFSTTNDIALELIIKLGRLADGVNASVVSRDIKMNYELNESRVVDISRKLSIGKEELTELMMEE